MFLNNTLMFINSLCLLRLKKKTYLFIILGKGSMFNIHVIGFIDLDFLVFISERVRGLKSGLYVSGEWLQGKTKLFKNK